MITRNELEKAFLHAYSREGKVSDGLDSLHKYLEMQTEVLTDDVIRKMFEQAANEPLMQNETSFDFADSVFPEERWSTRKKFYSAYFFHIACKMIGRRVLS